MTQKRFWWFHKDGSSTFVHVAPSPTGKEQRLSHKQSPKRALSAVKKVEKYKQDNCVKVFFVNVSEKPTVFGKDEFAWNRHGAGLSHLKNLDIDSFVEELNNLIEMEAENIDGEASLISFSIGSPSQADAGPSCSSTPTSVPPSDGVVPTPKRPSAGEIPVLFKKRLVEQAPLDDGATVKDKIKKAFHGIAVINITQLELGPALRSIREPWVNVVKQRMKAFPTHVYQPLVAVLKEGGQDFRLSNANGYFYEVVGGCHNFTATKELHADDPGNDIFRKRVCAVYDASMSREAVMCLANEHNKIGGFSHKVTFNDKLKLCQRLKEEATPECSWAHSAAMVFGKEEAKGLCKIADLEKEVVDCIITVGQLFEDGQLKGQRLTPSQLANPPEAKSYLFNHVASLPPHAAKKVLMEAVAGEITVKDMKIELKCLSKLHKLQRQFVLQMGASSWEDLESDYPFQCSRGAMEAFSCLPMPEGEARLTNFCQRLKAAERVSGQDSEPAVTGVAGSKGYVLLKDAMDLDATDLQEKCPGFTGANLVILDKPKEWDNDKVKQFVNGTSGVNNSLHMTGYVVALICETHEMSAVMEAVQTTGHFQEVIECFYAVTNVKQTTNWTKSVGGLIIARKGENLPRVSWASGTVGNLVPCEQAPKFVFDDKIADDGEKPIALYNELIRTFTSEQHWVVDACTGTGTGLIASLRCGRNIIAIDSMVQMINILQLRLGKDLVEQDLAEEEETNEDDVYAFADEDMRESEDDS